MLNKTISVIIEILFPKSHLQTFLQACSQIHFETHLTPQPQKHTSMFYPFYYKDPFVHDCIFELKERNSADIARLFGTILSRWIMRKIDEVLNEIPDQVQGDVPIQFYLVPVPQHISKTKEKGFCHTTTLARSIYTLLKKKYPDIPVLVFPCVSKIKKTKKLHDTKGRRKRFSTIKETMCSYITKRDAEHAYFFIIDDVYTTGATFKEVRRSLKDCAVPLEHVFFISIAH